MFWKLAVSALLLPAYLGFSGVAAQAASNTDEQLPAQEVTALQEPQYYANRYNNQNDCYGNNRSGGYYRNSYRPQRSYRQNSYHQQRSYHQNSYHQKRHNSGYHQNSYQPQHHNGYQQNYGHGNYYNH